MGGSKCRVACSQSQRGSPQKLGLDGCVKLNIAAETPMPASDASDDERIFSPGQRLYQQLRQACRLPLYIIEGAQTGLVETISNICSFFFFFKGKSLLLLHKKIVKKRMEQKKKKIKNGGDPYGRMDLRWQKRKTGNWRPTPFPDVVKSKSNVDQNNGRDGITWLGGTRPVLGAAE